MQTQDVVEAPAAFGQRLRHLRHARGLSLRQLARQINYTYGYLSKLENGSKPPVLEVAEACDAVLDSGHELVDLAQAHARELQPGWQVTRPAQLPAGVADFVGRERELEQLDAALAQPTPRGAPHVVTVEGAPGMGKTTVALRWAHAIVHHYPDGQLAANLHGYDRDAARAEPGDVLEEFLRSLGVPSMAIPAHVEERARLFRSLLEGKRMLVLLDNAAISEQVLPLVPATSGSLVVVTTRTRLSALAMRAGAARVTLDALSDEEAHTLLQRVVGAERIDAEPDAGRILARRCGNLPLAVRVASEHVAVHRHHSLAELARELDCEGQRLNVLSDSTDELSTRAVFSWSYRELRPEVARMFRLLGLHAGTHISLEAAAALAGCQPGTARRQLERLAEAHLIDEVDKNRYRFHDLLRVYAAERVEAEETEDERAAAVRRVLDWYLHSAAAANTVLAPQRGIPDLDPPMPDVMPLRFAAHDYDAALAWCEREATNLVAAARQAREHGHCDCSWRMAVVNWNYYFLRKHWNAWIAAHRHGLQAARDAQDRLGEAWCLHNLGMPHLELRRFDDALSHLSEAVRLRRDIDDLWGLGWSLFAVGSTYSEMGRFEDARRHFEEAIEVFATIEFPYGVGTALSWLGTTYRKLDRHDDAHTSLTDALKTFTDLDARDGEGFALVRLGAVHRDQDEHDTALDCLDQALRIRRDIGDTWGQGEVLLLRGTVLRDRRNDTAASQAWHEALALFDELSDPRAADARAHLATLDDDID